MTYPKGWGIARWAGALASSRGQTTTPRRHWAHTTRAMLHRRRAQAGSASRAGRLLRRFPSDPGPGSSLAVSGVTHAEPLRRTLGSTGPQPPPLRGSAHGRGLASTIWGDPGRTK